MVDKAEACRETEGSGKDEKGEADDVHVAKIEENRDKFGDFELAIEIKDGVGKHVEGG